MFVFSKDINKTNSGVQKVTSLSVSLYFADDVRSQSSKMQF